MSFEPGDIVKKKEEDQLMTVFRLLGGEESSGLEMLDDKLYNQGFTQGDPMCQWFVGEDLQSGTFHTDDLEKASSPEAEVEEETAEDEDLDFSEFDDLEDASSDASSEETAEEEDEELNLDDFDF
ncbi:MAG: hypothetical protein AAF598_06810 [Bacteroidota bacterium]